MMRRAVFLDRDGVLNRAVIRNGKPYPPDSVDELEMVPEAARELNRLKDRGFLLVVVTNQPDVARGRQTREAVEAIHARMRASLPLDEVRVCYHDDRDGCSCRKPKAGLLLAAAGELGIDLPGSFMVGDRWRDVDAGAAAGCRTVWIDSGYQERGPSAPPDFRAADLCETVSWILQQSEGEHVTG
ncbi:MAG: HAD family hydrolase [Bryobacter sp.]|nr:HAD family hydrolase [Bryobacter sp.]